MYVCLCNDHRSNALTYIKHLVSIGRIFPLGGGLPEKRQNLLRSSLQLCFGHPSNHSQFQAQNDDNLWSERARRKVILAIISEWLKGNSKKTTVKKLLSALNGPGWFDVKLRVEKLLLVNVSTIS